MPAKQAYWNSTLNTWGGSVYNDSGKYHMFMSALADGKTLDSWASDSYVTVVITHLCSGLYPPTN